MFFIQSFVKKKKLMMSSQPCFKRTVLNKVDEIDRDGIYNIISKSIQLFEKLNSPYQDIYKQNFYNIDIYNDKLTHLSSILRYRIKIDLPERIFIFPNNDNLNKLSESNIEHIYDIQILSNMESVNESLVRRTILWITYLSMFSLKQNNFIQYFSNKKQEIVKEDKKEIVEEDKNVCIICFENEITHIIIPCGHMILCSICCNKELKLCPICRKDIDKCIKVYQK